MTAPSAPGATLSSRVIWSYAGFAFPLAMLGYPLGVWLPRAYATANRLNNRRVGGLSEVVA